MPVNSVIGQYFFIADEGSLTWDVKFREDLPFDKLTRLYIAFAWIQNGTLTYGTMSNTPTDKQRIAALVGACKKKNPLAQVFISSGFDASGQMYKEAARNPTAFADSVVAFLRANGLDGYDMDWENGLDMNSLNALLLAVRKALDAASAQDGKTYGLTLATWQYRHPAYDLKTIGSTVDAINIMSYGQGRTLEQSVQAFDDLPKAKMIGGIEAEDDYQEGGPDTLGPNGTIAQKARFARQNGLAGMMAWRLDNDHVENNVSTYRGPLQLYASMSEGVPSGS